MRPTTVNADPGSPFIDVVRDFAATPAPVFRAAARDTALANGMSRGILDSMDRLEELLQRHGAIRGKVMVDITMSLDGYVTANGAGPDHGLGVGGRVLHDWAMDRRTPRDAEILRETVARTGAVIMGRRTFDIVDGPNGWGDERGYGGEMNQDEAPPVFVVTRSEPEKVRLDHLFTFVTSGLESALAKARAVAGSKDVVIMGGGNVSAGFLRAGLVDVLSIHLAPVVLGGGTPLFPLDASLRLELIRSESTSAAEHLTYRVTNDV
jgi:dihydrofolate reductase